MSIYERPPTFLGSWNMSSPLDTRADAIMAHIHDLLWAIHSGAFYTHASHLFNVWLSSRAECCFPKVHGLYWLPSKVACDMDLVINECPYIERPPTFVGSWNMTTPLDTRAIGMLFVMLSASRTAPKLPAFFSCTCTKFCTWATERLQLLGSY